MAESGSETWQRRAATIPAVLFGTALLVLASPVLIVALAARDLLRGRSRLPAVRVLGFLIQYAVNDSVEVMLAPALWIRAGFGRTLDSDASLARHKRVLAWSMGLLERRAHDWLGIELVVVGDELTPAPVIVLAQHRSSLDSALPAVLYQPRLGFDLRFVLMRELVFDPAFDLFTRRTGSVFVRRQGGPEEREAIERMARELDSDTVGVIFPEGQTSSDAVRARRLDRLERDDPVRADRLRGLSELLPPKPGGFLAMLEGSPTADVVVLAHSGLEPVARLSDLARRAPLAEPVIVDVRRFERSALPTDTDALVKWLDERWLESDRWMTS
jgi:1-acyl-sn-glycerol-3-phosphate acyltransferase